jgi:hypothetical protein
VPLNGSFATVYFVCASVAAVHSRSSYYPYLARNVRTSHTSFVITRRVTETAAEILRHLTLRASTPTTTSNSGFGSFLSPLPSQTQAQQALVQSQDDVSRVQALLLLQADR